MHPDFAICPDWYYCTDNSKVAIEHDRRLERALRQIDALTAASPAAVPSDRPANAAGGCDDLSAQTPGPAGVEASTMDLFGRMGAR